MTNGVQVKAWTFDEFYGRNGEFLDGLDHRGLAFVAEVPPNFQAWLERPQILRKPPKNRPKNKRGNTQKYPRLSRRTARSSEVKNLARWSPALSKQKPQRYRIKETHKGPEVWEIRWETCWRKTHDGKLVSRQCTLIVARNVETGEVKYFISNRVPGRDGWSLRALLRVAFSRAQVEGCFREAKEELGMDHFECRGWRCIHRHLYVAILSGLFCARVRQKLSPSELVSSGELLTMEQVRRAANVFIESITMPPKLRNEHLEKELARQRYYKARNATAARSHKKTRTKRLKEQGIDPEKIKSVPPKSPPC